MLPLLAPILAVVIVASTAAQSPTVPPSPAPAPEPAPPSAPAPPQRVHIYVDRTTEASGTVVSQDDESIVIERDGKTTTYRKDAILDIIGLYEIPTPVAGVIYRRDGSGFRAEIIADDFDEVRYRIGKVPGAIARKDVYRIGLSRPFEERYKALRESVHPDDFVRRLALCDWLVSEKEYDEARTLLLALVADSKLPEAVALLKRVDAQLALLKSSAKRPSGSEDEIPPDLPDHHGRPLPTRVLTNDEVNLLRVYEIDFDRPPRVEVAAGDTKQLIEEFSANPLVPGDAQSRAALMQGSPLDVVRLAFGLKARDFYPKIKVVSEPWTLAEFRRKVHDGWLIPNCATSRCHGGPDAGLFLFNTNTADARVRYTNLLTLLRFPAGDVPLISFENPGQSLLIQHALPIDEASHPHPAVKGWRPVLGTKVHPQKLAETEGWIRSLYQPRPTYPIDYTPPDLRTPQPGTPADADEPSR